MFVHHKRKKDYHNIWIEEINGFDFVHICHAFDLPACEQCMHGAAKKYIIKKPYNAQLCLF